MKGRRSDCPTLTSPGMESSEHPLTDRTRDRGYVPGDAVNVRPCEKRERYGFPSVGVDPESVRPDFYLQRREFPSQSRH